MLGKRNLYLLVREKIGNQYNIPRCKLCSYSKYRPYVKLTFPHDDNTIVSVVILGDGSFWNRVVVRDWDTNDIISDFCF